MNDKESFSEKFENFIGGKGFYIVLFAAIAVIGLTAWLLISPAENAEENYSHVINSAIEPAGEVEDTVPVSLPDKDADKTVPVSDTDKEDAASVMNPVEVPIEEDAPKSTDKVEDKVKEPAVTEKEGEPEEKSENASNELTFTIPVSGSIAVPYSPDSLIFSKTMRDWRTHAGIDIEAPIGTKVKAVAQGSVLSIEKDDLLGTVVTIDHGDGLLSIYANLAAVPTVKAGDAVAMGSVIGSVGDTALGETGEVQHLHFAMTKAGVPVDPYDYIPKR